MPHFNKHTQGSKIHTIKGGGPCPHAKANPPPKGRPSCNYRKLCGSFPYSPWEAHHVLSVEAVNAYGSMPQYSSCVTEIDDCYKLTDWCINQKPNLLGMPLKEVYRNFPASRTLNIPCHDWDHTCKDGYFEEVVDALEVKIWKKIKKAVATANQSGAHFSANAVLQELQDLERDFQTRLSQRGQRKGGTASGWANQGSKTNEWWLPFSMAKDSVARRRKVLSF